MADGVDCYSVDTVIIGINAVVSQRAYLCTASRDIDAADLPLVSAPIVIADHAWVGAESFIGPGVTVGERSVVAARAVVTRNVDSMMLVAGVPARAIRRRALTFENQAAGSASGLPSTR